MTLELLGDDDHRAVLADHLGRADPEDTAVLQTIRFDQQTILRGYDVVSF
jgi:hypothetical protein